MKTKHLLTALALPALFAACTADDIVTEGANQAQRVALNENFKMDFGSVESRVSAGEPGAAINYKFEEGDMVGSAIIDKYDPTVGKTLDEKYQVVEWASTNQPWTYDGAKWTINHTMVEGKYLFYYPYNDSNNSRGPVQYSIPVMQDLSDKTTGEFNPKAAIERYAMSIGYQFITKDDLYAKGELRPIFANARIIAQLDNAYAGGEVEKVVLQSSTAFNLAGQLNHKEIERIFKESTTVKNFKWSTYNKTAQFAITDTEADYYDEKLNVTSPVIVGKVPAGATLQTDAQGVKTFETYMVVPAQNSGKLTLYIYMTDGRVLSGSIYGTTEFKCNVSKKLTFSVAPSTTGATEIIAAQKDWNEAVNGLTRNATFIIADPNFTITNDMKYSEDYKITINGNVNVSGDDVTMKNVAATTITVAEGAKLTTDYTTTGKIINKGEVVVAEIPETKAAKEYNISEIENHATLTINKKAEIATVLINKKGATVTNAGKLTINSTEEKDASNNGTIVNEGSIYVAGTFVNEAREYKNEGDEVVLVNEPKIDNKATGSIRTNAAAAELENNSELTNAGILSIANSNGLIENTAEGVIDAKSSSTTFIKTNTGKVKVYSMTQADLSIETQSGVVEYTATAATVDTKESVVTNIVATKDLEIKLTDKDKAGKFNYLTTDGNATIKFTWPTGETVPTIGLNVKSGKTIINTSITVDELIIAEGASVSVPAKVILTLDNTALTDDEGNCTNEGTISVIGKLIAESYFGTEDEVGQYDDNGKGSFTWKKSVAQANEDAFDTAVYDYFHEFLYNSANAYTSWKDLLDNTLTHAGENAKRAALVSAYNTWKGLTDTDNSTETTADDAKKNETADVKAILAEGEAAKAKAAVATLKSEAETAVNDAIALAIANKDLTYATWRQHSNDTKVTVGLATIGGEEEGEELTLKLMWEKYAEYLGWDMQNWEVEENDVTTKPYAKDGQLIRAYKLAIKSMIEDANMDGEDADGEAVVPSTPSLTIPAGSYIDASGENTIYKAVKAWIKYSTGDTTNGYIPTDADYNAELKNIQNWYLAVAADKETTTMDELKAKEAATLYKDTVVTWKEGEFKTKDLQKLVDLINNEPAE